MCLEINLYVCLAEVLVDQHAKDPSHHSIVYLAKNWNFVTKFAWLIKTMLSNVPKFLH